LKKAAQKSGYFVIINKLLKVNYHPIGEEFAQEVTLVTAL
jgi:hypothetical protein